MNNSNKCILYNQPALFKWSPLGSYWSACFFQVREQPTQKHTRQLIKQYKICFLYLTRAQPSPILGLDRSYIKSKHNKVTITIHYNERKPHRLLLWASQMHLGLSVSQMHRLNLWQQDSPEWQLPCNETTESTLESVHFDKKSTKLCTTKCGKYRWKAQ